MKVLRRNFHPHVSLDADFIVHPFSHISRFCLWSQLNWVAIVTYSVGLPEQKLGTRCGIFGRFKGLAKLASIVCPTSVCEAWSATLHGETGKQAQNKQHLLADKQKCFWFESKTFLLADVQNVLAKHEMFEEIGGGETSKQGQEVESVSWQANNVGQFHHALRESYFERFGIYSLQIGVLVRSFRHVNADQ